MLNNEHNKNLTIRLPARLLVVIGWLAFAGAAGAAYSGAQLSVAGATIAPGQDLTYTITVQNTGTSSWPNGVPNSTPSWLHRVYSGDVSWIPLPHWSYTTGFHYTPVSPGAMNSGSGTFSAADLPTTPGTYSFWVYVYAPTTTYGSYYLMTGSPEQVTFTISSANNPPATPGNVSPANAAPNQPVTPTLQASAFSDPDSGDTHAASQWQVLNEAGTVVVANSGTDTVNKVSWTVPGGKLDYGSNYVWQVRYQDNRNGWSSFSSKATFSTVGPTLSRVLRGTDMVITWPTNTGGFSLQWASNLGAANWRDAVPAPVIVNGQYAITNTMTSPSRFYQLKK